jgi:Xaa-Pro aminopeptidase
MRLKDSGLDVALITSPDSIYYFSGYWGFVGPEFGRPTVLVIRNTGDVSLIMPQLELELAKAQTWIQDIQTYRDGIGREWLDPVLQLADKLRSSTVGIEIHYMSQAIAAEIGHALSGGRIVDCSRVIAEMRMVKSPEEIAVFRQAGQVTVAMAEAGRATLEEGVPEYEIALAMIEGGTRKAAALMRDDNPDDFISPLVFGLQAIQSGSFTKTPHRRASMRRIKKGERIFACFCGIATFKQLKPAMDRQFLVGDIPDTIGRYHEVALAAQRAAISVMRPGATAEEAHLAALEVYKSSGFAAPNHRTGRAVGYSVSEMPQLKLGDKTVLQPGMLFAVDGEININDKSCSCIGDTILVTKEGAECLTECSRDLN